MVTLITTSLLVTAGPAEGRAEHGHTAGRQSETPGTLISAHVVSAPSLNGTAYQVEYWSKSVPKNKPVKITGLVVVPEGTAPAGGWPVVSWGHPTDGMTGNCAPSLDPDTDVPFMNDLLAQGWEVTSSDYLNEDALTPTSKKVLPYFVGEEAARNVIDIVRAARHMSAADAGSNYQVWGWSEGGQTALWVNDIASSYAPELSLMGAVATAPAAEVVSSLYPSLAANPEYWPLLLMLAEGVSSAYGNKAAPLKQLLTTTGITLIGQTIKKEPQCLIGIIENLTGHYSYSQLFLSQTIPPTWQRLLNQSDPADFSMAGPAPVLLVHGSADTTAPTSTSASLAQALCSLSPPQPLERWVYAGLDHVSIMGTPVAPIDPNGSDDASYTNSPSAGDVIQWMSDRFADGAWPDPYVPTGGGITTVSQTNSC
jgi:fermentation-respiration switch protein FrsA (DUF1100 family)